MKSKLRIKKVDFHRNGCSGEGFFVVLFGSKSGKRVLGEASPNMVATVFSESGYCAVLDLDDMLAGEIDSAWRGDYFEHELRQAIETFKQNWCWPPKPAKTNPAAAHANGGTKMKTDGRKVLVERNGLELVQYATGECRIEDKARGTCSAWLHHEQRTLCAESPHLMAAANLDETLDVRELEGE